MFPLSTGAMIMESSYLRHLRALCSAWLRLAGGGLALARLAGGGLALARHPTILVLARLAWEESALLRPLSTAATISGTGIFRGAGAKFRPLAKTSFFVVDRVLEERFDTHLSLNRLGRDASVDCSSKESNFLFCRHLHSAVI